MSQPDGRAVWIGVSAVLAAALCYASGSIMAGLSYERGADATMAATARFVLGGLMLAAIARCLRPPAVPRGRRLPLMVLGAVSVAASIMLFASIERVGAGTATLLLYLYPAMVASLAALLGRERFGGIKALALATSLAGIALVIGMPPEALDGAGIALGAGAALGLAVHILIAQRAAAGIHPVLVGAWAMIAGAFVLAIPGAATLAARLPEAVAAWGWLLGVGIASGTAFALIMFALPLLGASRTAIGGSAEPVLAVALAAMILGERLGPLQLAGGVLIVAAVALLPLVDRPRALGQIPAAVPSSSPAIEEEP